MPGGHAWLGLGLELGLGLGLGSGLGPGLGRGWGRLGPGGLVTLTPILTLTPSPNPNLGRKSFETHSRAREPCDD